MYTQYFGFRKPPFKLTPDSGFFYTNAVFLDAHCSLLDAIDEQRGLSLLTGEHGTGKTTLLKRLAQDLDDTVHFIYLQNSNLTPEDLVGRLLDKLGIAETGQERAPLEAEIIQLRDHVKKLAERQQGCVLFIDDAQNLPADTLGVLPLLIQAEDGSNQLQMVLSGSPELLTRLTDPAMSAVSQLIAEHAQLDRLPAGEIAAFIDHQIRVAGSMRSDIFSEPAIREITQTTSGRPSDINQVCDKALEIAYRQRTQVVTREIIRQTSSPSWLEMDDDEQVSSLPASPFKRLTDKAANSLSDLHKAGRLAPRQLATRIAPLLRVMTKKRLTLGRPIVNWGRHILDKLGVIALIAVAKLWKLGARTWNFVKSVTLATLARLRVLRQNNGFKFRRRHAWAAAGLTFVAALVGLIALVPGPDTAKLADRTAPEAAFTEVASASNASASKEQAPAENASGRQLSEISALRSELAQAKLDLRTTVSNRNYLQKRVATLTRERDDLVLKHSQGQFAQKQLELTLAATRKQLADLQSDLSTTRALAQLSKNDVEDRREAGFDKNLATTPSQQDTLSELSGIEGVSEKPLEANQTEVAKLDQPIANAPMDYLSNEAEPLVTAAGPVLSDGDDTPIIGGVPQISETGAANYVEEELTATPASDNQQISALPASGAELSLPPKKTFSDQTVALLMHKARRLYLKDMLTTPAGNNAYDVYMQILEGNPGHARATAGIEKIASRYLDWAETEVNNGNKRKALRYYRKALSVVPGHADIAARIAVLEGNQAPAETTTTTPSATAELVQSTPDAQQSEAARARLKTLRIEVSERSLLRAVEAGNQEITGLLIDAGISPDAQNVSKQTALLTAAINGNETITKLLLERGADVNKTNSMGRSPLIAAAWNGNASLVSLLLKGGAEIETTSKEGWNALMYAAWNGHSATVLALLKSGVQVDAVNAQSWTALMNAAWNGHSETVRVLLDHGADARHKTPAGETALSVASQQGHREAALLLE